MSIEHVNEEQFSQLQNDMGEDFGLVVDSIITSIQSNLDLLNQHESASHKDLIRYAHSIKSPAANLGATHLAGLSDKLEQDLRNESVPDLDQSINDLENALDQLIKHIP